MLLQLWSRKSSGGGNDCRYWKARNFLTSWVTVSSQGGLCSMEWVSQSDSSEHCGTGFLLTCRLSSEKSHKSTLIKLNFSMTYINQGWLNCSQFPYTALSASESLQEHWGEGTSSCISEFLLQELGLMNVKLNWWMNFMKIHTKQFTCAFLLCKLTTFPAMFT
jgi:hypothetical protein